MAVRRRSSTHPLAIGIFVVTFLTAIVGVVIWLGASRFFQEFATYATYFDVSVEGLEKGRPVKYQGVPVGTVREVRLAPDGRMVEVLMDIDPKMEIKPSLRVKSELAGIAGGKFLQLFYPEDEKDVEKPPVFTFVPDYPVIYSAPTGFDELSKSVEEVVNNLLKIDTEGISDESIAFLRSVATFFNDPRLMMLVERLDKAGMHAGGILARADSSRVIDNMEATTEALYQMSEELLAFSRRVRGQGDSLNVAARLDSVVVRYSELIKVAEDAVRTNSRRSESLLLSAQATLDEIRISQRQLTRTLEALNEEPSMLLVNPPQRPEK